MVRNLQKVIEELEKHKARMLFAKKRIEEWGDINEELFEDPQKVAVIDSFIFRFTKFQDALGKKLFPLTLKVLGEDIENQPFLDWLNRLEKLGLVSNEEWFQLRALRNKITHTYPWETEKIIEDLKEALNKSELLLEIFERFKTYLGERNLLKTT